MGIIEFLTSWIKDIAIVFVIISIIEIMLPNTNMKKYINMIIGFLIIIVIISPFVRLLNKDLDLKKEINKDFKNRLSIYDDENSEFTSTQEQQIEQVYIKKFEKEIKDLVQENTDYYVEEINIYISKNENEYGGIKDIELILGKNIVKEMEEVEDELISINNIEKVSIGEQSNILTNIEELEELTDDDEIKNIIFENYNISKKNIKLYVKTFEEGN